ncbi:retrovirus-related Pol polyprotein from transposon 17.6 [Trichonephila clavipes]|nr:retrovirus-related Pol polyprotein from transposon 17.6 [Trichonephila clavipes]
MELKLTKRRSLLFKKFPTNVKEIQSLLQTCSWFCRYVPYFAEIARLLSSLTKKKVQWHWGPEQQESFETLKMRLMTYPILKQADGSKPFTIRSDASNYALGAVLHQGLLPCHRVCKSFDDTRRVKLLHNRAGSVGGSVDFREVQRIRRKSTNCPRISSSTTQMAVKYKATFWSSGKMGLENSVLQPED